MPYKRTTNDWFTKHGECFVKFTEPGKRPVAAAIQEFVSYNNLFDKPAGNYASDDVFVKLKIWEGPRKFRYETLLAEDSCIAYEYPPIGATSYKEGFVTLIRRTRLDSPAKYRQSISGSSVAILDSCGQETVSIRPSITTLTLDLATAIFDPVYLSVEELTSDIYNLRRIGGALSIEYGMKIGRYTNKLELWKNGKLIAFVEDGIANLPETLADLAQEIESFGIKAVISTPEPVKSGVKKRDSAALKPSKYMPPFNDDFSVSFTIPTGA